MRQEVADKKERGRVNMLDWTGIEGLGQVTTQMTPTVGEKLTYVPMALTTWLQSMGVEPTGFNFSNPFIANDQSWTDRMVDRFTGYLDLKIAEFQQWITQGLFNFGQGVLMLTVVGGQLVCILYGVAVAYKMLLHTKKDEDYITKIVLSAGGTLVFRSLEAAIFGC